MADYQLSGDSTPLFSLAISLLRGLTVGGVSCLALFAITQLPWNGYFLLASGLSFAMLSPLYVTKDILVLGYMFGRGSGLTIGLLMMLTASASFVPIIVITLYGQMWYCLRVDFFCYLTTLLAVGALAWHYTTLTAYRELFLLYTGPVICSVVYHGIYSFLLIPIMADPGLLAQKLLILSFAHPLLTELKMQVIKHTAGRYKEGIHSRVTILMDLSLNTLFTRIFLTRLSPWWLAGLGATSSMVYSLVGKKFKLMMGQYGSLAHEELYLTARVASIVVAPMFSFLLARTNYTLLGGHDWLWAVALYSLFLESLAYLLVRRMYRRIKAAAGDEPMLKRVSSFVQDGLRCYPTQPQPMPLTRDELLIYCYTNSISLLYMVYNFRAWPAC